VLRHELAVLRRQIRRPPFTEADREFLATVRHMLREAARLADGRREAPRSARRLICWQSLEEGWIHEIRSLTQTILAPSKRLRYDGFAKETPARVPSVASWEWAHQKVNRF